ncbi:protein WHAT'S THIS FACTOR 1 homolog, chloroplastic [Coffea eugenioides]|uniref:protein WHAT'S THIS FACTOR 1 homolog, chloroplastic n=1 Tax=Coffea eugenioides TaxID=49369 RepID=UPI000F60AB93|nr:protein WHAT'S THIS FACTOR 1 homolog, chloroplastic [Coffea eugenioides]
MGKNSLFRRMHKSLESFLFDMRGTLGVYSPTSFGKTGFMRVSIMHISSGGSRPKKKIYYRAPELDKVMDLQKKPAMILRLKSIIQSQKDESLLLRDLEKEVGFVQKWNFVAVIEKNPSIFHVTGGDRTPPRVMLTHKAGKIAALEAAARDQMEPILVKNLRKLLMLSINCRVPMETVELVQDELGLASNFKESLIPKYPQFFSLKAVDGRDYLHLEHWDSSLAVTIREERLACKGSLYPGSHSEKGRISKDGNFQGPFAFQLRFPAGFRPNMSYLKELERWQRMEFPSPYLNASRFNIADPKARKRVVGVLHELLSLTMEKRLTSGQLEAFHSEYQLPARLLLCLIKHHGIFYLTNKGAKSTVILKEGYEGSTLVGKCPLLVFRDKFISLTGRKEIDTALELSSSAIS